MGAEATRLVGSLGRSAIVRLPRAWVTPDFEPGAKVQLSYNGREIRLRPVDPETKDR